VDIISIIAMCSIVLNVGLILRERKQHVTPNQWRAEIGRFYTNMDKLGYDRDYADFLLRDYHTFEKLREVNREMTSAITKQML
jgi:hypothetical protein